MVYRTGDVVEVTDGFSMDYAILRGKRSTNSFSLYCDSFSYSYLPASRILRKVSAIDLKGCTRDFKTLAELLEVGREAKGKKRRAR